MPHVVAGRRVFMSIQSVLPRAVRWVALLIAGSVLPCAAMADDGASGGEPSDLAPVALACDGMTDPVGIDSAPTHLSWKLVGDGRDLRQTAWEILVASSTEALARGEGDRWRSGRVEGDDQFNVPYGGRALKSAERVFWKVRVWDAHGHASGWSAPASWTMGLLTPADWTARWIALPESLNYVRSKLGYHSQETKNQAETKWIQIDLGAEVPVAAVRLHALRHTVPERIGFPDRFKVEVSDEPSFREPAVLADYTAGDYPNPWATLVEIPGRRSSGRYVRLTATKLNLRDGVAFLALSQVEVISHGKNVAVRKPVTASDSWERDSWSAGSVVDGLGVPESNPLANRTVLLRRDFTVKPGLKRALLFSCGLGQSDVWVNGKRPDASLLTPGWTNTARTCLYDSRDVTAQLSPGANALAFCLAGGMYNVQEGRYVKFVTPFRPLIALAQLRLEYADGSVELVKTDDSWRAAPGPATFANMYGGEDYDARAEPLGWRRAGFSEKTWAKAAVVDGPGGILRGASHSSPAFVAHETLKPVSSKTIRSGVSVYDLGQNASIMLRLRVRGVAGSRVKVIPAELTREDGTVDRSSCSHGDVEASWNYTLTGAPGGESWEPDFFYHGSRYLQVELTSPSGRLPTVEAIEGVVVHSDSPAVGEFACSNELFNRIRLLVRWAQRSNLAHVLTDCPHRERLGWLEQYHLNGPSLRYEFDLGRLYAKTFQDMDDSQLANGLVPSIAPEYIAFPGDFRDSPEWGSAIVLAAWQQYVWTGDDSVLRRHFPAMEKYVAYLGSRAQEDIVSYGLGDWYDVGPGRPGYAQLTPIPLTATAIYFECNRTLSQIAERIGRTDDARRYAAASERIKAAFNRRFFNNAVGSYATGSQTALAMPLALDLVAPDFRKNVVTQLVREVEARDHAITAGDVGYRYLLRALAEAGRSDVIVAMTNQSDKPGYGYQLAHGCTSLTEAWNADPRSSQNHFMLGQIMEWFYHDLAGLAPDPAQPGFKRIVFHPQPVDGVEWARASHETPRGRASVSWRRDAKRFVLRAEVPANATGEVWIPTSVPQLVEESGEPAVNRPGLRLLRVQEGYAVFAVGSGQYDFAAPR
ncbi:alpha-L-rhamnosidase [Opitutaceae bacterium EW11]|nr:alpha-L-rhamnosidase [Opitutaceae bacterium EW11]